MVNRFMRTKRSCNRTRCFSKLIGRGSPITATWNCFLRSSSRMERTQAIGSPTEEANSCKVSESWKTAAREAFTKAGGWTACVMDSVRLSKTVTKSFTVCGTRMRKTVATSRTPTVAAISANYSRTRGMATAKWNIQTAPCSPETGKIISSMAVARCSTLMAASLRGCGSEARRVGRACSRTRRVERSSKCGTRRRMPSSSPSCQGCIRIWNDAVIEMMQLSSLFSIAYLFSITPFII